MPILTCAQAYQTEIDAGFSDQSARTFTAMLCQESGLNSDSTGFNKADALTPVDSRDRGIAQINDYWHKEVSDECAYDPVCAIRESFRISDGGTDFSQWASFTSGRYLDFLPEVNRQIDAYLASQQKGDVTLPEQVTADWVNEVSARLGIPSPLAPPAPVPPPPAPSERTYTVQTGDSLWNIAEHLTGNGPQWTELYNENADVIGVDPNMIQPGMILKIPANWP